MELHSRRGRILLWLRLRRRGWLCGGCRLPHSRFRASVNLGCTQSLRLLTVFGFAFFAAGSVAAAPSAALHTPQTVQTYAAAQRKQQALDAPRSRRGSCTASRIGRPTRSPTSRVRRSPPAPARSRRPRSRSAPGTAAACGRRSTRCTSCVHAFSGQPSEPVGFATDTTVLPYLLARLSRPGRPQGKPQAWSPQAWPPQAWPPQAWSPQAWPRPARPLWQPLPVSPAPSSLAPSSSSQQTQLCAQAGSLSIEASRSGSCVASHGELAGVVGVLAAAGTAAGMLWAFRSAGEAVGVAWPMAEG